MAAKDNPQDQPVDFDDLLALTQDDETPAQTPPAAPEAAEKPAKRAYTRKPKPEVEDPAPAPVAAAPVETEDQKRIRELKEALAAPMPKFEDDEPDVPAPPKELTEEQKLIKELEDQLAKRNATILESAPQQYVQAKSGDTILIHFLEDGFTALGTTWYRGQELEFEVGGQAYEQTKDRFGKTWLDLAGDVQAQYDRWGKQYMGIGKFIPRPNEKFEDEVAKADARRGRAVPLIRG